MQFNGVQIENTPNVIVITDSDQNQVIVTQPLTSVVEVSSPGPQGPKGESAPFVRIGTSNTWYTTSDKEITGSLIISGSNTFKNIGTGIFSGSLLISGSALYNGFDILTTAISGGFVNTSSFNVFSSSYVADSASFNTRILINSSSITILSGSFLSLSSSYLIASASFDSRINLLSASFQNLSSSYVINSGSVSTRLSSLEQFSSSLDATFATDAQLNAATASLSSSIAVLSSSFLTTSASFNTRINDLSVSSSGISASLAGYVTTSSFNSFSSSYNTGSFTGSFTGTGTFSSLNTTTATITGNVTVLGTASINTLVVNQTQYTSGSNQLGDNPTLDTQTLFGKVIITGSLASTGSAGFRGGDFKVTDQARNAEFDVDAFKVKTQTGTQFTGSVSSQNGFTGSLQGTASFATNATSASFASTASNTPNAVVTASVSSNTITFTKGDASTFNITVATGSVVNTGSLLVTASISNATTTFTKGDGSTFSLVTNNVVNADSASLAATATTASFAQTIADGLSPTFANATASNVLITGTASVALLYTQTVSSSVIFTSGSNQLGDSPTLDTQTLFGKVIITGSLASTGSAGFTGGDFKVTDQTHNGEFDVDAFKVNTQTGLHFTGSVNSLNGFTGSLLGTASFANTASYISNAVSSSFASTASYVNTLNQAVVISGSINVSGSVASSNLVANWTDTYTSSPVIQQVVTLTQAEYNAISSSANVNTFYVISDSVALNPSTFATTGSNTFIGNQIVTGSVTATAGFTGSLLGTASYADSALSSSYAITASYALNANVNTGSFATTGSNTFIGNETISGSLNVSGSVTGNVIGNNTDTYTSSPAVQQIVTLTQAEYNAIGSPNANTLYIISGSVPFNSATFATTGSNTFNGNQIVTGSVTATSGFTGSLLGTASFADSALSSSFATTASYILNAVSASFATSASLAQTASFYSLAAVTQNAVFSGSVRGEVKALTISSNTASLDCSLDNFFTLTLVSGSNTFVNPSNILPGQTINLRVKQASVASGSISFASSVKQVSGSAYTPTATANGEDVVTFISFDSTNLYLSNIKNFV